MAFALERVFAQLLASAQVPSISKTDYQNFSTALLPHRAGNLQKTLCVAHDMCRLSYIIIIYIYIIYDMKKDDLANEDME